MAIDTATNLDYIIEDLRLHLGDIDSSSYRYVDAWLRTSIVASVKALMQWWNYKYLINDSYNVERNSNHTYLFTSPPLVERGDERAIVLMAAIIIKMGSLENASWSLGRWRDAEISYSNIEGSRAKQESIKRDLEELEGLLSPPNKRLAQTIKGSLPGYLQNEYESAFDVK
jgi:hypothetical protein